MDSSLTTLIQQLWAATTYSELCGVVDNFAVPVTFDVGSALIQTAAELSTSDKVVIRDNVHILVEKLVYVDTSLDHPITAYISLIQQVFAALAPRAQYAALWLLTKSEDIQAVEAHFGLLEALIASGRSDPNLVYPFTMTSAAAALYFPRLLQLATPLSVEAQGRVCQLLLYYCGEGYLNHAQLEPCVPFVLDIYRHIYAQFTQLPNPLNPTDENYPTVSWSAGQCLDLMGFLPASEAIQHELMSALTDYSDVYLKSYAVTALLKLGVSVAEAYLVEIAANHACRNDFYERLIALGKTHLYPSTYKSRYHFAISDMVRWLCFPTELGRPPDEIELIGVVSFSDVSTDKAGEYFIFRFCIDDMPPEGWEVGWSGPYPAGTESTEYIRPNGTFSSFERWGSKPHQQIVRDWLTRD
jgi:hypothetical protein